MTIEQMKALEEAINEVLEREINVDYGVKYRLQSLKLTRLCQEIIENNKNLTEEQYKELFEIYKDFNEKIEKVLDNIKE